MLSLRVRKGYGLLLTIASAVLIAGISVRHVLHDPPDTGETQQRNTYTETVTEEASILFSGMDFIAPGSVKYRCDQVGFSVQCNAHVPSVTETSRAVVEEYLRNANFMKQRLQENEWKQDAVSFEGKEINFLSPGERRVRLIYNKNLPNGLTCHFTYTAQDLSDLGESVTPDTQAGYSLNC